MSVPRGVTPEHSARRVQGRYELVGPAELQAWQVRFGLSDMAMATAVGVSLRSWRTRKVAGWRMRVGEAERFRAVRAVSVKPHVIVMTWSRALLRPCHPRTEKKPKGKKARVGCGYVVTPAVRKRKSEAQLRRFQRERAARMGRESEAGRLVPGDLVRRYGERVAAEAGGGE